MKPGRDAADDAAPQITDVDRDLERLRPGEHVREVQQVDELAVGEPAAALDRFLVHDPDLGDRSAEGVQADPAHRSQEARPRLACSRWERAGDDRGAARDVFGVFHAPSRPSTTTEGGRMMQLLYA
jgi:hypothetical protein